MLKGTYGLAVVSPAARRHRRCPAGQPARRRHRPGRTFPGQRSRPLCRATPRRWSTCTTARCACCGPTAGTCLDADHDQDRGRGPADRPATAATPTRGPSSTTCSRRSTSSRKPWPTPCVAGSAMRMPRPTSAVSTSIRSSCAGPTALILTACGTSYHAALVGEYLFEEFARIPVEVEYASEFRYRNPPMDRNTIVLAITQSGETADTLAALRESKRKGIRRWPCATWSAAASPARPTAASICMPAPKSAWPAPRLSAIRSRCWPCSPCTSAGCGTCPACKANG